MAYNQNVPQPADRLKDSQQDLKDNFQAIKQLIDVNHGTFSAANEGKHKFVTMPTQGASPGTVASEIALFSRSSTLTSQPEMAFQRQSNGSVIEFTSAQQAQTGWTRLPSNILLKWGFVSTTANEFEVVFPTGGTIPAFSNIFNVQISVIGDAMSNTPNRAITLVNGTIVTTKFKVWGSQRTTNMGRNPIQFYYFAIGN